jgi:hypothetical protein
MIKTPRVPNAHARFRAASSPTREIKPGRQVGLYSARASVKFIVWKAENCDPVFIESLSDAKRFGIEG